MHWIEYARIYTSPRASTETKLSYPERENTSISLPQFLIGMIKKHVHIFRYAASRIPIPKSHERDYDWILGSNRACTDSDPDSDSDLYDSNFRGAATVHFMIYSCMKMCNKRGWELCAELFICQSSLWGWVCAILLCWVSGFRLSCRGVQDLECWGWTCDDYLGCSFYGRMKSEGWRE